MPKNSIRSFLQNNLNNFPENKVEDKIYNIRFLAEFDS